MLTAAEVLYAVPGSPLVAERTVELLLADARVDVEVVPGLSFTDLAWARLGVDPVAAGVRLVDGHRFAVEAAGERGPLLVAQCDSGGAVRHQAVGRRPSAGAVGGGPVPPGPARRVGAHRGLGRPRPGGRARPPHVAVHAGAGRAGGRRGGPLRRAGAHPAGTLPVGPGADPRHPHPPPAGGDVRGAGGDRGPRRARSGRRASTTWRRSWATCCSRWCSTPPWPPRRASSPWPTWPGASTTSSSTATPRVRRGAGRHRRRGDPELGADQAGGEGADVDHGRHRRRPAVAALRPQGPAQGRVGGAGAGGRRRGGVPRGHRLSRRRGSCCSRPSTGSGGAGSTRRPPCGRPPPGSGTVSWPWNGPRPRAGLDLGTLDPATVAGLWRFAKPSGGE